MIRDARQISRLITNRRANAFRQRNGLRTNRLRAKGGSLLINGRPHSGLSIPECGHNRRTIPLTRLMARRPKTGKLSDSQPIEVCNMKQTAYLLAAYDTPFPLSRRQTLRARASVRIDLVSLSLRGPEFSAMRTSGAHLAKAIGVCPFPVSDLDIRPNDTV